MKKLRRKEKDASPPVCSRRAIVAVVIGVIFVGTTIRGNSKSLSSLSSMLLIDELTLPWEEEGEGNYTEKNSSLTSLMNFPSMNLLLSTTGLLFDDTPNNNSSERIQEPNNDSSKSTEPRIAPGMNSSLRIPNVPKTFGLNTPSSSHSRNPPISPPKLLIRNSSDSVTPSSQELPKPIHDNSPTNTSPSLSTATTEDLIKDKDLYLPYPGQPLWSNHTNDTLPTWLTEYLEWHQQQRQLLNESNWKEFYFLVSSAFKGQRNGGMTDRIRPILSLVRLAAQTQRILLIYWERPFALEHFLLPPQGGLDWRVPKYMTGDVRTTPARGSGWNPIQSAATNRNYKLVTVAYQSWHYGDLWYNEVIQPDEPPLLVTFRHAWHIIFTPSLPVAQGIHHNFRRMGVFPGEFATTHMRALYAIQERPKEETERIAINAMNCISNLRPGGPFFVASDSLLAIQTAIRYGKEHNVTVVTAQHPQEPLHVGLHTEEDQSVTPSSFYDGFVDLYLMQLTRCTATGPGGFARWGIWLGFNESCYVHHSGRKSQTCEWKDTAISYPGYSSEAERLERQTQAPKEGPRFYAPDTIALSVLKK
ncbi:expressed unknown protein [Seminavis robusta]|uniref:Uncharacterized protein n=1 Tax=Seminavis robusta TaxID=568900 RepID=A0A9N8EGD4_9STRA|nr:expressed unknown protein [Seminavis robusta]|eukprot:Sro1122_g243520.1 n/a (587) ;mRNA; f:19130-20890